MQEKNLQYIPPDLSRQGQLLVDRAIAVSAQAHIRQYRKGTDTPYIAHTPMRSV